MSRDWMGKKTLGSDQSDEKWPPLPVFRPKKTTRRGPVADFVGPLFVLAAVLFLASLYFGWWWTNL